MSWLFLTIISIFFRAIYGVMTKVLSNKSKSSAYTDGDIIVTAVIVFGVSLVQVWLLLLSFFSVKFLLTLGIVTSLKFLIDLVFFKKSKKFFLPTLSSGYVFLLSIVYPFYTVFVAISSLFSNKMKWWYNNEYPQILKAGYTIMYSLL